MGEPRGAYTDYDIPIPKVLLVGDSGVGKTSLLSRFADNTFPGDYLPTIGVEFKRRTIELDGIVIKMQMWDTAGQERFRAITTAFYRGAYGVIIVYDVTNQDSFNNLEMWLENADAVLSKDYCSWLLIGNKCDLTTHRQVAYETAKRFADKVGIPLVETSAKDSTNVDQAFVQLAADVMKKRFDDYKKSNSSIELKKDTTAGGRCC